MQTDSKPKPNQFDPSTWGSPPDIPSIQLDSNQATIMQKRYRRKYINKDGKEVQESPEETLWRIAYNVAVSQKQYKTYDERITTMLAIEYYKMLSNKQFFPNTPTFTGAGTPLGQLAACFVLPLSDDMGKMKEMLEDRSGIMQTLRDAALIQQSGGGNGFPFSNLREKGAYINSSGGISTGPIGFLEMFDYTFGKIQQGGTRRGANMAVFRVDHPDILEFINCKKGETAITNFNISVAITDEFMVALEKDQPFNLIAPHTKEVVKTINPRVIFDEICKNAHSNGEPGVLFIDEANRHNPVPNLYTLEATNPCGEQWLGPYENCCLGSINLAQFYNVETKAVDWERLGSITCLATTFLDDVVSANKYVPSVPQLRKCALKTRRIGLGIMGLHDLMIKCEISYGSKESLQFVSVLMEWIRYKCMTQSVELARQRSPFPEIKGSIYDYSEENQTRKWAPPTAFVKVENDFGRPPVDWQRLLENIKEHGIRNAAQTTVAPTGTIASVAGCEGYGCEPIFGYAYKRHVNDNGKDMQLQYTSQLLLDKLNELNLDQTRKKEAIDIVNESGSVQDIPFLPKRFKDIFRCSGDLTVDEHVEMQASIQAYVDNSISKTCNCPNETTVQEVEQVYMKAWKSGCKGITIYRDGSRQIVVLETKKTSDAKTPSKPEQELRPSIISGDTIQQKTPCGSLFLTLNDNDKGFPCEVFLNIGKSGSDLHGLTEALGRTISILLSSTPQEDVYPMITRLINQYRGIGSVNGIRIKSEKVESIPHAISIALLKIVTHRRTKGAGITLTDSMRQLALTPPINKEQIRQLCKECGQFASIRTEGCMRCENCGYSEC